MIGSNDQPLWRPHLLQIENTRLHLEQELIRLPQKCNRFHKGCPSRVKQGGQSSDNDHQVDRDKPMTYREVVDMMTKTRDEGRLKKKGIMPKYPPEMDLVPYPPKYKSQTF